MRHFLQVFYHDYAVVVAAILQDGINSGEFHETNAHDVAVALAAIYEGMLVLSIFDRQTIHWREHTEAAVRLLHDGLRSRQP